MLTLLSVRGDANLIVEMRSCLAFPVISRVVSQICLNVFPAKPGSAAPDGAPEPERDVTNKYIYDQVSVPIECLDDRDS